jgi:hypothetical protein
MGTNIMMSGRAMITGVLGLMLFLAAADAQEPRSKAKKTSAAPQSKTTKMDTSSQDTKSREDAKGAAAAALLESAYEGEHPPEAVRMLTAVLRGSRMGTGEGWFGPADNRYSWKWLASRSGVDPAKGGIPRSRFQGSDSLFARLDRDKDGSITQDDFDWSDRSPYVQMARMVERLFGKVNAERDGRLTKEELIQFFDKAAQGKDYVTPDDFRDTLLRGLFSRSGPSDMPSQAVLIRGLFSGELGSMNEGPKLNDPAPDFTLKTSDGKETIHLAKRIGPKPVVLVFGSFT